MNTQDKELNQALLTLITAMTEVDNTKQLFHIKIDGIGTVKLACQVVGVIPEESKIVIAG